ncbi:MAG TPA: hypothetical protein VHP33_35495 [Polyangiaceae bacterium]|nr:hypothetical protein [Polyangiaceae bacterium]
MKSLVGKFGMLAMVAMAGIAVTACSSSLETSSPSEGSAKNDEHVGTIGLKLQPVLGITVANVHYTVTAGNPAATPAPAIVAEGNLPTPGTSNNFSFGIPLPVGTGYYISLSGVSAETGDDITCTGSYGSFNVQPNTSSLFNMVLTCVDNTKGQVLTTVDVQTDACPRLIVDYAVAEPGSADVGENIAVFAAAHDLDNAAEVITYAWSVVDAASSGVGSFTPATAKDSTFKCNGPGNAVKVKVTATNHECSKSLETIVSCTSVTCGDGVVDPTIGETCDFGVGAGHPADPGCPQDCTKVCGDGQAEGSEVCDSLPFNAVNCLPPGSPNECTPRPEVCGDGFTTGTELCDTLGNIGTNQQALTGGNVCNADCKGVTGPVCGNGIVSIGFEECDDSSLSRTCSNDCESISDAACVTCEQAGDCFASSDNCLGNARPAAQGGPFTVAEQNTCTDVMQCIQDSNCLDGTGSLGKCYCGTLSTAACGAAPFDLTAAGAPNGPCAAIMQAGNPGVTSNSAILGGLTNKARPAGAAGQRLNCQKTDANCAPICGVQ